MAYRWAFFLVVVLVLGQARAQTQSTDPVQFYRDQIQPLLASQCYTCHTDAAMGGLRLDSRDSLLKGGQSGPAVVPGSPEGSLLIQVVSHTHEKLKMPPQGKLAPNELAALRAWIDDGAHFATAAPAATDANAASDSAWSQSQRSFWSFQPVGDPALPAVSDQEWPTTGLDSFILAGLEKEGLQPAPPAGKTTLLRRVTYDLTGLPPTAEEYQRFLEDDSPDAFAKVVERLLASPRYGETWGRFWLDVARYADEDALGLGPEPFPNSFRYRDWVIRAFNDDMPYDLFLKAQIAGDMLEEEAGTSLRPGLGLFALGPWYYKIVEPPKARADELHDRIDVLSRGFLGLTVACARCHDHKYDPISTRDYYALGGILTSTEYAEFALADRDVVSSYDSQKEKIDALKERIKQFLLDEANRLGERLAAEISRYLVASWEVAHTGRQPSEVASASMLDEETLQRWGDYLQSASREHRYLDWWDELGKAEDRAAYEGRAEQFQRFVADLIREQKEIAEYNQRVIEESKKSTDPYDIFCKGCRAETKALERDKYMLWTELFGAEQQTNGRETKSGVLFYGEGKIERLLALEDREQLLEMRCQLESIEDALPERYPFLHVITDKAEPRDMLRHMRGDPYSLGETVPRDYLSVLGHLEAIPEQQSGRLQLAETIASPDNPLTARVMVNRIWHHHFGQGLVRTLSNFGQVGDRPSHPELLDYLTRRFLDSGWSIKQLHREVLLSSAYQMSTKFSEKGYAADPENRLLWRANRRRLNAEALRDSLLYVTGDLEPAAGGASFDWYDDKPDFRRTVYGNTSRFRLERFLSLFDFPDPTITSERREITNTPLQRLFFLNSDFIVQRSRRFIERLDQHVGPDARARIRETYQILFGREPTEAEHTLADRFVASDGGADQAWHGYARVLLSSNEFLYID